MKVLRVLFILVLMAVVALPASTAQAQSSLPPICSGIQYQNKGAATAQQVQMDFYHVGDNDSVPEYTHNLPYPPGLVQNQSIGYYVPSLLPGALPSGAYSVIISSDQPLNSLVNQVDCDLTAPKVASSYSGFDYNSIGTNVYLSYVVSRFIVGQNWSSAIAIQNAGSATATNIVINFYPNLSGTPVETFTNNNLAVGETWYMDLHSGTYATAPLNGFYGSAKITSDQPVAAIVNYAKGDGSRMLSYNGVKDTSQKLFATQLSKHFSADDYTGGFVLYNDNATATPISMKYYAVGSGTPTCTVNASVPANAAYAVYLGSISTCTVGSLPNGFNGYGVVEVTSGTNKLSGIFNFDSVTGQAGAANMVPVEKASTTLYFPQIVRSYAFYESGWQVVNTTGSTLLLDIYYYKTDGTLTTSQIGVSLLANRVMSVYVFSGVPALGTNWNGGIKIVVQGAAGGIVGQANFVSPGVVETLTVYNGFNP